MKKMLFFAAMSAIALTSCVNEGNFESKPQAQVMRFDAPVMKQTRANIKGEINGVHYATGEDFVVYCKYYPGNFASWTATGVNDYFTATGDTATNEGNNSQYWSTANVYYWPEIDYNLAFAAYSPAKFGTKPTSIKHTKHGLQIEGFKTEAVADDQYDLMYSERVIDRNKSNNGSTAVPLVFHHALSSIVFSSEKEDENVNYKITDIVLNGKFIQQADFNQNIEEETNLTNGEAKWDNPATAADATFEPSFDPFDVTTVPSMFTKGTSALLLIPQAVPASAEVTIEYQKIVNPGTANETVMDNRATIKLSDFRQENGNEITTWEMGKRYVYRIAFGQNKRIYFEPTTTDWIQESTLIYTIQ